MSLVRCHLQREKYENGIRKNPQRRFYGAVAAVMALDRAILEMKAVTEACMMTGVFLYSDAPGV